MALLKKTAAPAPFRVPTLAEADPDNYGSLLQKRTELHSTLGEKRQRARILEKEIAADTSPAIRPGVAALLGDGPSTKSVRAAELKTINTEISDLEAAVTVVEQRIRDAKTPAVRCAIALVRPEWNRRRENMLAAMKALHSAYDEFNSLCLDLQAEDISTDHFGPRPFFLGDPKDGHLARFIRDVSDAQ